MTRRQVVRAVIPALLLAACNPGGIEPLSQLREQVIEARRLWADAGIETYSFQMSRSCICTGGPHRARVEVTGGAIRSLTDLDTGLPVAPELDSLYRPVEGLFDLVSDILDRNPGTVSITWDGGNGAPRDIAVNFVTNTIDDDLFIVLRELTEVAPSPDSQ